MSQSPRCGGPDVGQLSDQEWPLGTFPGTEHSLYRIFFTSEVHAGLWQHAAQTLEVEICGVLVGRWGRDSSGPFLTITAAIRGEASTSKFAEVTFTHDTWSKINREMDTTFSHLAIVGWYHSHPDFGVFLSERDVFIQEHFFSSPGHVALVIDPVQKTEGVFFWKNGRMEAAPYYWVGNRVLVHVTTPLDEGKKASSNSAAAVAEPPLTRPVLSWLGQALAYLCALLLGFLLASRLNERERYRLEQDAVARAALLLGVKPGLHEALEQCLGELKQAGSEAEALLKQQQQAGEMPEAQQEQWTNLRTGLGNSRERLRVLQAQYCLTPTETQRLMELLADLLAARVPGLTARQRAQLAEQLEGMLQQGTKQGLFEQSPTPPQGQSSQAAEGRPPTSSTPNPGRKLSANPPSQPAPPMTSPR